MVLQLESRHLVVSFKFGTGDLDDGEIRPSSFTNPSNAATGVA